MPEVYSIRESLQGKLFDYVRASGFSCIKLEQVIRDLVSALAAYREEDLALFPEVYVFASPDAQKALPGPGGPLAIRLISIEGSAQKILKDCAPLAVGGWAIYVCRETPDTLSYGLFRSQRHSFSTSADETLAVLGLDFPVILIRNRNHQTVELRNSIGAHLVAIFNTSVAQDRNEDKSVSEFVLAASLSLPDAESFRMYMTRLLSSILQQSHGTLLAVCPKEDSAAKRALGDAVALNPPISVFELHAQALNSNNANALADLQAAEALIRGMVNSDGVIVFRVDGTIIGYRAFMKPSAAEGKLVPQGGGGRRRTYELMKLRVPKTFTAVLVRSQDGETACHRS